MVFMIIINNELKNYKIHEAIPIVSSITSLVCIILKKTCTPSNNTKFGRYLNSCSFTYLSITLIPLVNIIAYLFRDKFVKNNKEPLTSTSTPTKLNTKSPEPAQHLPRLITKSPEPTTALCPITSRPIPAGAASGSYSFNNYEILKIHSVTDTFVPYEGKDPSITAMKYGNKHTVTQGTTKGCSAGASLMLALDHGKIIDYDIYTKRGAASATSIVDDLAKAGLKPVVTSIYNFCVADGHPHLSSFKLSDHIKKNGPAIVRIQDPKANGAHWVILDDCDILSGIATIRDPWHGWCVDVKMTSFLEDWQHAFDQIQTTKTPDYIIHIPKTT